MINQIMPVINFVLILLICMIAISNFVFLHKHRYDKSKLINEISDTYPLVKPKFYTKTLARQTVENNQELREHDGKFEIIESRLEAIEKKLGIKD